MASIETLTRKIATRLRAEGWIDAGGGRHDKFPHSGPHCWRPSIRQRRPEG